MCHSDQQVYENTIVDCRAFGVKIMKEPQAKICGNDITLPPSVDEDDVRAKHNIQRPNPIPIPIMQSCWRR